MLTRIAVMKALNRNGQR